MGEAEAAAAANVDDGLLLESDTDQTAILLLESDTDETAYLQLETAS